MCHQGHCDEGTQYAAKYSYHSIIFRKQRYGKNGGEIIIASSLNKEYPLQSTQPEKLPSSGVSWKWEVWSSKKSTNVILRPFAIVKDSHERINFDTWCQTFRLVQ